MATNREGWSKIQGKISGYKSTIDTQSNESQIKKNSLGNNFDQSKSEAMKQLNAMGDIKQRAQQEIRTTFDELIDLFKQTMPDTKNTGSTTLDFLIKQILLASESTKSRMNEIVIEEVLNVAGCSQEQTFNPQQKIYISVEEIDLREILKNDPTSEPWSLRYEKNDISVGTTPFSMDRELNHRLQNEGISFS